eukprot:GHVU01039467.1.p1 GENE.GHVU01039467.1~~GHVU01039467.1.p1  ORF type:complete len:110 (+),score=7.66 GHVU01039467.1:609-938(+)
MLPHASVAALLCRRPIVVAPPSMRDCKNKDVAIEMSGIAPSFWATSNPSNHHFGCPRKKRRLTVAIANPPRCGSSSSSGSLPSAPFSAGGDSSSNVATTTDCTHTHTYR